MNPSTRKIPQAFPGPSCFSLSSASSFIGVFLRVLMLGLCLPLSPRAQTALREELEALAAVMPATVGIAVIIDGRDIVTVNNDQRFPLMSVFKFHQALAVADRLAARGRPLETEIWVTKEDLAPNTCSPLRDARPEGNFGISVAELLRLPPAAV